MRKSALIFFSLLFLSAGIKLFSQDVDSVKNLIKTEKQDTALLNHYAAICEICEENEIMDYGKPAIMLADKLLGSNTFSKKQKRVFLDRKASLLNDMGIASSGSGDIPAALKYYSEGLKIREELDEKRDIAVLQTNIGLIYKQQGNIPLALEYYHKGLKTFETLGDKNGIAVAFNNIGLVYKQQGEVSKALEYYNKALALRKELGNDYGVAATLGNIGYIYLDQRKLDTALACFKQCIRLDEKIGDKDWISTALTNIGYIYELQNDLPGALENYKKSLALDEAANNKEGVASALNCIGGIYLKQRNYSSAMEYSLRSLKLAREVGFPSQISDAARLLRRLYEHEGNFKKALEMEELHINMRDSLSNERNRRASIKNQLRYEYEKKTLADSIKNAGEQKVKDAQIAAQQSKLKQEKTQRYALYGGLILIGGFLFFVFNRFRLTQKQKKIIESQKAEVDKAYEQLHEKNKEVLDSIYYARRIQRALLPSEKYIERNLKR